MDLYTILNGQLNSPTSSWRLIKEETLTPKSAKVSAYISITENQKLLVNKNDSLYTVLANWEFF